MAAKEVRFASEAGERNAARYRPARQRSESDARPQGSERGDRQFLNSDFRFGVAGSS